MDPPAASQLCDNCRGLEFDDAAAGGSEGVDADGNPCLRMPVRDGGKGWYLNVDGGRSLVDTLPDLPNLASSAQSGCEFCALLLASILSEETARHPHLNPILTEEAEGVVEIFRNYWWIPDAYEYQDAPPGQGFLILLVCLHPYRLNTDFDFAFRVEVANGL